jgi:hypothetical protein
LDSKFYLVGLGRELGYTSEDHKEWGDKSEKEKKIVYIPAVSAGRVTLGLLH